MSRPAGRVLDIEKENEKIRSRATRFKCVLEPRQTWSEKDCAQQARYIQKDGLGTPWPYSGSIQDDSRMYGFGVHRSLSRAQEWPVLHPDFELVHVSSWGVFIRKKEKPDGIATRN